MMYILDLLGTATFAVTGALAAGRKRMDIFGVVVLGCVTAIGGGTLRDVILGNHPVFWISNNVYLLVATLAAVGTFLLVRYWRVPMRTLVYADAAGLAIFTVIGFQRGLEVTGSYSIAVVMGVTTGVVGGMIRDVLAGEIPLILRREIYASASLCGAILFALMHYFQFPGVWAVIVAVLTIFTIRLAALRWNVSLPLLRLEEER
ncbi:trimeric intracellular cation channel family protein [Natronogracilivirga saccharolytica]|uniref:Trimeric intracellular cation channel family protein n=1 Tax=Natronogracilivirga saccharolytica TaxID=2812953 RepID=A0A8J7S4I6_9BACT|nr:trimeric intracellular cation channel family protein [Natronogracilivirga saccharolytica]MBP3191833.1 trimeric intracellular cation channel family protein [Natronogracilivirga saccharolytica]